MICSLPDASDACCRIGTPGGEAALSSTPTAESLTAPQKHLRSRDRVDGVEFSICHAPIRIVTAAISLRKVTRIRREIEIQSNTRQYHRNALEEVMFD